MYAFTCMGLRVQPFKCGPDYIDTKFHAAVCRRPSVNLDTFMASPEHVRQLYARYSEGADVCIVEGMMGLYDGYDRHRGSCAEVARLLELPVVLVVDARSAAYSMAPLLQGFINFRPKDYAHGTAHEASAPAPIAGVIFNRVGSERHRAMLQQVCLDIGIACFGFLPRQKELEQGERYLGLDFSQQHEATAIPTEAFVPLAAALQTQLPQKPQLPREPQKPQSPRKLHAVVARNTESFSFIYQETLDALGTDVSFFDPERDVPQLDGCHLLYLPGGYPEKHLPALVANEPCRTAIRRYAEAGGRIIAECGGMMYLCRAIITDHEPSIGQWPMCGVLPHAISARHADRHLSLGYRQFTLNGRSYRGHEFHYTQFHDTVPPSACKVYNAKGEPVDTPVLIYNNVLASYTHLYLNETNLY